MNVGEVLYCKIYGALSELFHDYTKRYGVEQYECLSNLPN